MPVLPVRCLSALGLALALAAGLTPLPAEARRSTTREAATAAAQPGEPEVAWTAGREPADCQRTRRKFWQAGDGWMVKTVTTCR
ncbi:hypothetical protein [Methylobacterium sp. sgz302541]|uniref:hypothetical protein n=1 Tax=unclassified Methylobacterium TaxID=2615210 RepID=UPI003D32ADE9